MNSGFMQICNVGITITIIVKINYCVIIVVVVLVDVCTGLPYDTLRFDVNYVHRKSKNIILLHTTGTIT